jgi:hypothetical protein
LAFYTDKASLFQTAQRHSRDEPGVEKDPVDLPPTQIGRAWQELSIVWIAAHSPQAKGRVERGFSTAQDRLVKGLRIAGAGSLEQANAYLEQHFLPWWNGALTVAPKNESDAHRPLAEAHDLPSILSHVDERQISNGYTVQHHGQTYQIPRHQVRTGMRGAKVRVEVRLDGSVAMRFDGDYLRVEIGDAPQPIAKPKPSQNTRRTSPHKSRWMQGSFDQPALPLGKAIAIANATS